MTRTAAALGGMILVLTLVVPVTATAEAPACTPGTWEVQETPASSMDVRDIAAIGPSNVWAIGSLGPTPAALHYDGSAWTQIPVPAPAGSSRVVLNGVGGTLTSDAWAVGTAVWPDGSLTEVLEHWDGATWSVVPPPTPLQPSDRRQLSDLTVISSSDAGLSDGRGFQTPTPLVDSSGELSRCTGTDRRGRKCRARTIRTATTTCYSRSPPRLQTTYGHVVSGTMNPPQLGELHHPLGRSEVASRQEPVRRLPDSGPCNGLLEHRCSISDRCVARWLRGEGWQPSPRCPALGWLILAGDRCSCGRTADRYHGILSSRHLDAGDERHQHVLVRPALGWFASLGVSQCPRTSSAVLVRTRPHVTSLR